MSTETNEFLNPRRIANVLLAAFGVLCLTIIGWFKATLDGQARDVEELKIEAAKIPDLQEQLRSMGATMTGLQMQNAALQTQVQENTSQLDELRGDEAVNRKEIHGLFENNAKHDLTDPPKKK